MISIFWIFYRFTRCDHRPSPFQSPQPTHPLAWSSFLPFWPNLWCRFINSGILSNVRRGGDWDGDWETMTLNPFICACAFWWVFGTLPVPCDIIWNWKWNVTETGYWLQDSNAVDFHFSWKHFSARKSTINIFTNIRHFLSSFFF